MRIEYKSSGEPVVMARQDEAAALCQTLNEALHGFHLDDSKERLGAIREPAEVLMQKLQALFLEYVGTEEREINLLQDEATVIQKAALLCLEHISSWEFSTRVGASVDEVRGYIEVLGPLTNEA